MLQTSPIEHLLVFVRPVMTDEQIKRLLTNAWNSAYDKGFRDSDRGHEILEEPEFILTEHLKIPLWNDLPEPNTRILEPFIASKYAYHYWAAKTLLRKSRIK